MNRREADILIQISLANYTNQRVLAEQSQYSLGTVNQAIKALTEEGYLTHQMELTLKAKNLLEDSQPKNAIILAAGYGMRMVPINTEVPKGLIKVNGECMIERTIRQLREVGVENIYVVVGFLKEMYEYLIDEYNVKLLFAPDYATKNNLHSLNRAVPYLGNSYIVPCDIWSAENPFSRCEPYSWYMVSDEVDNDSTVRVNRQRALVSVAPKKGGNAMLGIAYFTKADAEVLSEQIRTLCQNPQYDQDFWETALFQKSKIAVQANVVSSDKTVEINTYEQLRKLDKHSKQLQTEAIRVAAETFAVKPEDICNIQILKKGMTNRSFLFQVDNKKYIMRIPGEGTDQLINRAQEAEVYQTIANENLSDRVLYINPVNGFKITEYLYNARTCDPANEQDLEKCMEKLRHFHSRKLKVNHTFDIFGKIEFYESLWNGTPSIYPDYASTKAHMWELKPYIEANCEEKVLTHIDAVPDNFLFTKSKNGEDELRLIDWEYAGMQDPHVDVAMFCIYALYEREQVDHLIDLYFQNTCSEKIRTKIYCYIAVCGLLWSNWCEYKRNLGIEFGEYSLKQYRYAKDYYKIAKERIEREYNQ